MKSRPTMHNLGDEEAFFRSGEEGTYEGGPASVVPFVLDEEPRLDCDLCSADQWLERRRRFKRLVAGIVGGLGAGLLILAVCLLAARARGAEEVVSRPQTASLPRVASAPRAPAATTAIAVEPAAPTPPPPAGTVVEPARAARAIVHRRPSTRSNAAVSRRRTPSSERRPHAAAADLPRGSADLPAPPAAAEGRRAPPTALFPSL